MTEAVKSLGKTQREVTHITACCNGRRKTAFGYIWKREFDLRLKLDRDKLNLDKEKAKKDAELKLKQINKPKTTTK